MQFNTLMLLYILRYSKHKFIYLTAIMRMHHAQMANFIRGFTCIQSPSYQTRTRPETCFPNLKLGFGKKAPGLESLVLYPYYFWNGVCLSFHAVILIIIIIIICRQFLTRRNTTDKSLQGRASTQWLMTCHTEIIQCLDTYQLGAVSGEEERLQHNFKTVNRLLRTNV